MTNEVNNNANSFRRPRVSRFGRVMLWLWIAFVVLGTVALIWLRVNSQNLANDQLPYLESDVLNLLTYVLIALSTLGAILWILFFSGRRWLSRLGWTAAIIFAFAIPMVLLEPIFDGGMALRGGRTRFWGKAASIGTAIGVADLVPESADDFPQFLGPDRSGIFGSISLNADWQQNPPKLLWKQPIGLGWSGFATRNGFAVTMQQVGEQECVSCYRVDDGQLVWNYEIRRRHENILGGVGPRSTPTIHEGRVYAMGGVGNLSCLDGATGKPIWEVDLLKLANIAVIDQKNGRGESFNVEKSNVSWGRAASPLVYQSLVIVPLSAKHTLVALDRQTGALVWYGGDQPPGYGSPVICEIGGKPQVVIVNESSVTGHDPNDGTELWYHPRGGSSSGDANTSQATLVGKNLVLVSKGYGLGGELIRLEPKDERTFAATSVWKSRRVLKTKLSNPVVHDGLAYALSSEVLECVELKDGERLWRAPERFGHGQIVIVGKHILAHTEDGQLVLIDLNATEYRELGRIKTIEGVCWNTIAFYGDRVLVRSEIEAACFQLPTEKPSGSVAILRSLRANWGLTPSVR